MIRFENLISTPLMHKTTTHLFQGRKKYERICESNIFLLLNENRQFKFLLLTKHYQNNNSPFTSDILFSNIPHKLVMQQEQIFSVTYLIFLLNAALEKQKREKFYHLAINIHSSQKFCPCNQ